LLVAMRCDFAQGHWLSRPLAADSVAPWRRWAVGLAFGGTLALSAYIGAGKSAAGLGGGAARAPAEVRGFMPSCCTLDLPNLTPAAPATTIDMLADRTGHAFVERSTARANVYLESSISPETQTRLVAAVEHDLAQVETDYWRQFQQRPAIYVFGTRSSFAFGLQQVFGVRSIDAGLLGAANGGVTLPRQGAIVINLENVRTDGDLAIVRHELTHAMIHEIAGPDAAIPAWLDEGLATLEEGAGTNFQDRSAAIAMTLVTQGVSLDRLDAGSQWVQQNAALNGQAYDLAAQAASLLRARISPAGLVQALKATADGTTFAEAYAAAAGESLVDFERAFPARLAAANDVPHFSQERAGDNVHWTVSGFKPHSQIEITITGKGYAVTYTGSTDGYGMYSAVFGETAPAGDYTIRVHGPGGQVIGSFAVPRR
jgi:hypothetical protein